MLCHRHPGWSDVCALRFPCVVCWCRVLWLQEMWVSYVTYLQQSGKASQDDIRAAYKDALALCVYDIKANQLFDGLIALEVAQVGVPCILLRVHMLTSHHPPTASASWSFCKILVR